MPEARVQMPPIVVPREQAERIDARRELFAALLPGVSISRTWAFAEELRIGLDDLEAELAEHEPRAAAPKTKESSDTFFCLLPDAPRGSRWAPRDGLPADGFVRLPAMWIPRQLAQDITRVLKKFRAIAPGQVKSRAALIREALARAAARNDAHAAMLKAVADVCAKAAEQFPPVSGVIRLSVPIPARGRPPRRARSPKRRARRRTRRRRTRASRRRAARGDPDPTPARRASHTVGGPP
jgi:hypothetical protein